MYQSSYPFLSERAARFFARAANHIHAQMIECQSGPRDRRLADRYAKASEYLYSRIGRLEPDMPEPTYELVNDNEPWVS